MDSYAPPLFLLPLVLVFGAAEGVKRIAESIDLSIRGNNEKILDKMKESEKKKRMERAQELDDESTLAIEALKREVDHSNEDLARLLLKRATIRLEDSRLDEASADLKEAWNLLENLQVSTVRDSFLTMYLKGAIEYAQGDFISAGESFLKSIQLRESLVNSNNQPLSEDEVLELEREFVELQINSKKPIERTMIQVSQNISRFSTNFNNNVKNFFNHNLKLDPTKPLLKEKPKTLISLELLYVRSAISFYNAACYDKAITLFNNAISAGSVYDSDFLESSYYNRGLCYYYLSKDHVKLAIEDFTQSIALMYLTRQREQTYLMRACAYGRLGMQKEKTDDERKAKFINPFSSQISAFHIRILDDDTLFNILSFLPTRTLISSAGSGKVWRNVIVKYLQEYQVQISIDSMTHDIRRKVEDSRDSLGKIFLPSHRTTVKEFINNALDNSLLSCASSLRIPVTKNYGWGSYIEESFTVYCLEKFKNLKGVAVEEFDDNISKLISKYNPGLKRFELRQRMPSFVEREALELLLKNSKQVESLSFVVSMFTKDPFVNHPPSLKIVEYYEPNEDDMELCRERNGYKNTKYVSWEELRNAHPEITFVCLKDDWRKKIHEEATL